MILYLAQLLLQAVVLGRTPETDDAGAGGSGGGGGG
jgi:hypothetical protein